MLTAENFKSDKERVGFLFGVYEKYIEEI